MNLRKKKTNRDIEVDEVKTALSKMKKPQSTGGRQFDHRIL